MKRCQKCNFQSDAMLDYCWQCGAQLTDFSNAGQFYQSAQPTQQLYLPAQMQGFSNNYRQTGAPNYQGRANRANTGRIAAVLGGFLAFLLLVSGAGAAVIYKVVSKPPVKRYEDYRVKNPEPVKPAPVKESEPVKQSEPVKVNPTNDKRKNDQASAKFEKIWVDYNVTENGRYGMRIHVKFSVYNMKDVDSYLAVYFEKADGTKLRTANKKFSSNDGTVAVYRALKPGYADTVYKDLEVFMPYDELKLGRGKYDLKMDADVIYENGDLVEHLGYHDFIYEKK